MLADQLADTVGTGIAAPGSEKYKPYEIDTLIQNPQLINAGEHDCHINHTEKCTGHLI